MRSKGRKVVHVTHCIDVEGPMTETLEATWQRIKEEDGLSLAMPATRENLIKLQNQQLDIGVDEAQLAYFAKKYSADNLGYLTSWEEIDREINKVTSDEFRMAHCDPQGNPYLLNWFIYDHYGFTTNPRFHDDGIHHIYDHYQDLLLKDDKNGDGVYWHYHHVPESGDALEWNTNWFSNGIHEEILARRVIERQWFPSVFRAGGHIERNDLSFWLEMFIPYDYSARTSRKLMRYQGRASVNDWRNSPFHWGYYHPDWYDYRRPGAMKRSLFRCLDLRTWIVAITEQDVREAFELADAGYDVALAYYNHDFRPMDDDIRYVYDLIKKVEKEFSDVTWEHSNCLNASRELTGVNVSTDKAPVFKYEIDGNYLTVTSDRELFGPEPFLAIKENGKFFRDNMTRERPTEWSYYFRKPEDVEAFGIAGNSPGGLTGVVVHDKPLR